LSDPNPTSRRERRIQARRAQILDAAASLFAEKGFHRTTTKDIARAVDLSEGSLYNYFESKEELLLGIMDNLIESQNFNTRLEQALPENAQDFLYAILQERKAFFDKHGVMMQAVLSEILVDPELRRRYYRDLVLPAFDVMESHIQARVERGQVRAMDPAIVVRILSGLFNGLFMLNVYEDPIVAQRWQELSSLLTSILFDGVKNSFQAGQNDSIDRS